MALEPFAPVVQDDLGNALNNAEIEVQDFFSPNSSVTLYDSDGVAISAPYLTNAQGTLTGAFLVAGDPRNWSSLVRYRATPSGGAAGDWTPYPITVGKGAQGRYSASPAVATPCKASLTVPNMGVVNGIGTFEVAVTLTHGHMGELVMVLVSDPAERATFGTTSALDGGGNPMIGESVDIIDAVTGAAATVTDSGGTPVSTPYLTDSIGQFSGYLPAGIYQHRVTTSANIPSYSTATTRPLFGTGAVLLFDGPGLAGGPPISDFALSAATITFADDGTADPFNGLVDGDRTSANVRAGFENLPADGTWKLWAWDTNHGTIAAIDLIFVPV
jgi:hypothetical protein